MERRTKGVDRDISDKHYALCGVSNVGGQRGGLRELTMRSVTSTMRCVELATWVDRGAD